MTDVGSASGNVWKYRFSEPGDTEIETGEFGGDESAEARARELSKSGNTPVIVQRHAGHIEAWEYVTEVDDRP